MKRKNIVTIILIILLLGFIATIVLAYYHVCKTDKNNFSAFDIKSIFIFFFLSVITFFLAAILLDMNNSNKSFRQIKIDKLTEKYKDTIDALQGKEELPKKQIKVLREIFKSYANAMADI